MNTTTATTTTHTVATLNAFQQHDEWLGWGYLGERNNFGDTTAADQMVLDHANANGWTERELFDWANSKDGRWFADCALGNSIHDEHAPKYLRKQN